LVINNKREKTPTTVMTCSVNPQVQFVLNDKNEVMKVVALNNDGQAITLKVDFIGLDAEDAAEMFVKISTEAGYINPETEGTAVNFDLSGDKKSYDKLKEKITKQVNNYFDENGIIAGAVTTITEDFKEAIKTLKPNALNLDNKSQEELMEHYLSITALIEGIEPANLEGFYNSYNHEYNEYQNVKAAKEALINKHQQEIADYKEQIAKLPEGPERTAIEQTLKTVEKYIPILQGEIAEAKTQFTNFLGQIIQGAKANYETFKANLETEINEKIKAASTKLAERKTYYENNKSEVEDKIAAFRATLNA